jgi:hypothetical protein
MIFAIAVSTSAARNYRPANSLLRQQNSVLGAKNSLLRLSREFADKLLMTWAF